MFPGVGRLVADELLEPTRIYAGAVRELLSNVDVHAMAHITGGGLPGNVPRVLPEGCRAVLRRQAWRIPPIFRCLAEAGEVDEGEMFRTFNMGIGYVVIIPRAAVAKAQAVLSAAGETVYELGEIVSGERGVELA
jgi:phosphoribosylformylglycinamidine cyclo-ligase